MLPMMSEFQTMKGSSPDSVYLVFASKLGGSIGVRPLVFCSQDKTALVFGCRIRVVCPTTCLQSCLASTGLPFQIKGDHASLLAGIPICKLPALGPHARAVWENTQGTKMLTRDIFERMHKAGAEILCTAEAVEDYLDLGYEQVVPTQHVVAISPAVMYGL